MAASIIKVEFPRFGKVRCQERDLRFPQLYRITAFAWEMNADETELFATDRPVPPSYTLRIDRYWKVYANPTFTIDAPDANVDRGYIIVRHHESEGQAQGYQDAVYDFQHLAPEEYEWMASIYCMVANSSQSCIDRRWPARRVPPLSTARTSSMNTCRGLWTGTRPSVSTGGK
jgi:hypothetical protein